MTRVLVITGGELGARMAGPAIRAVAMATVLANDGHDVVLATTASLGDIQPPVGVRFERMRPGDDRAFRALERDVDVIVFQGHAMEQFKGLARTDRVVVADIYDPMHLEMLEQGRGESRATWDRLVKTRVISLNQQLARADFLLCASARQRSFYLGQLTTLGRISPQTYGDDPHVSRLLGVAPFGLDSEPPRKEGSALRGVIPEIDSSSRILLWGGGIYSWFDPQTLIRATHAVWSRHPETRLVFMGTKHPGVPAMGAVQEAISLARDIGALDTSVIFQDDWVPYDHRGNFLLEADAGVSTHHAHLETEFAFRTRILDYLWAGLPMVVTAGDSFADLVGEQDLGIVVPAGDQAALERALERILYDTEYAAAAATRVTNLREHFTWEASLMPLRDFVRSPHYASDVVAAGGREQLGRAARGLVKPPHYPGIRRDLRMAWHYWRTEGAGEVLRRAKDKRARR